MIGVRPAVHSHLGLLLHHADHGVRGVVDEQSLADRILAAEDVLGHLVAEEDDAAALNRIVLVEETAAGLCIVLTRLAVDDVRTDDAPVHGLPAVSDRRPPRDHLAQHRLQLRHALADEIEIVDARTHRAARRHALPRLRRLARPHHREVLAGGSAILIELAFQSLAERQQQQDRHCSPGD